MKVCGWHLPLLGVVALLLEEGSGSSSSHSLRNFCMVVSEPSPGLPQFTALGYVDDQPIVHYDSHTRRTVPRVPWIRKVEQDKPHYFEEESQIFQGNEKLFRETLATLMAHFHHNNSTGLHTLQLKISCKVWLDGRPRGGSWEYAYDGKDLLFLDMETPTWTACVPQAEILKQKLGSSLGLAQPQREKDYLEETCVNWLRKYVEYGNETLLRTEPPVVKVVRKKVDDGLETLSCQLYGFYPKEINVTWMKDGKDRNQDTHTGGVIPNSDGTYHTWLSINVDPKERDRYRCRVEHSSLPGPLERVWEEPVSTEDRKVKTTPNVQTFIVNGSGLQPASSAPSPAPILRRILSVLGSVLAVILVVAGVIFCMRDSGQVAYHSRDGDSGQVAYHSRDGDRVQWSPCSTTWNPTSAGMSLSQTSTLAI